MEIRQKKEEETKSLWNENNMKGKDENDKKIVKKEKE